MTREELLNQAKPILFNTEMVQAILEGRKTVTRRVLKLPSCIEQNENGKYTLFVEGTCYENQSMEEIKEYIKPPFKKGDYLYVRETWCKGSIGCGEESDGRDLLYVSQCEGEDDYILKAHALHENIGIEDAVWKPSIHMPKEVARIFLKVTDVRVERLQDIMKSPHGPNNQVVREGCTYGCDFIAVWESTIKKTEKDTYGWEANPWVWVIEFERIEA